MAHTVDITHYSFAHLVYLDKDYSTANPDKNKEWSVGLVQYVWLCAKLANILQCMGSCVLCML